jgi:hypothetical protein
MFGEQEIDPKYFLPMDAYAHQADEEADSKKIVGARERGKSKSGNAIPVSGTGKIRHGRERMMRSSLPESKHPKPSRLDSKRRETIRGLDGNGFEKLS